MGRMMPLDDESILHPSLPFSLAVAGMAATVAIITSLCGLKKPSRDMSVGSPTTEKSDLGSREFVSNNADPQPQPPPPPPPPPIVVKPDEEMKGLPPPPAMRALRDAHSFNNHAAGDPIISTQKLTTNLSPKGNKKNISVNVNKIMKEHKAKKAAEESVWTKGIMRGEKSKVPNDGDGAPESDDGPKDN